uniref:Zinc finger BED domain-containing protein 5 n=1 Tax=Macaca mulatta TaxID=9544 RepID=H9FXW8_MACMU
MIARLLCILS